jgi:hypothetical protein
MDVSRGKEHTLDAWRSPLPPEVAPRNLLPAIFLLYSVSRLHGSC